MEHFGLPQVPFEDMPAHRVDWWRQFMTMDAEVEAELQRQAKAQQQQGR